MAKKHPYIKSVSFTPQTAEFRIIDENGDEFISAASIRTCANMAGVSARHLADKDCADLNEGREGRFRVERVNGLERAERSFGETGA
jgi:hypothetical protein